MYTWWSVLWLKQSNIPRRNLLKVRHQGGAQLHLVCHQCNSNHSLVHTQGGQRYWYFYVDIYYSFVQRNKMHSLSLPLQWNTIRSAKDVSARITWQGKWINVFTVLSKFVVFITNTNTYSRVSTSSNIFYVFTETQVKSTFFTLSSYLITLVRMNISLPVIRAVTTM